MATYNNIKKLKIGDNVYNLYDSGGTVTGMTTTAGAHAAGSQTVNGGIITTNIPTKTSHLTNDSGFITSADLPSFVNGVKGNSESSYRTGNVNLTPANIGAVPTTRTVNSKALSSNITLTASDVSAVPTTRTVNSKALSANITLSASDVGALANSGGQVSGDITLYKASGDSPSLIFQRGTLTDDYNDWRIYNTGGYLHFQQRGQNSTSWTDIAYIGSNGVIYGNGSGLSGIPTIGDTTWSALETNFNYIERSGIVFVDFYKTNQSLSTSWTTIGTLPSEYRPNHNLYGAAMSLGTPQIGYFINSSSGVVQMRTNSGSGSYVTAFSVAYPVS